MKGIALLLKSLYPKLDWSTPQATLNSLAPGIDIGAIAARFDAALRMMADAAERQVRIESMLSELMEAWEQTKAARAAAGPPATAPAHRLNGGAAGAKRRHRTEAAA